IRSRSCATNWNAAIGCRKNGSPRAWCTAGRRATALVASCKNSVSTISREKRLLSWLRVGMPRNTRAHSDSGPSVSVAHRPTPASTPGSFAIWPTGVLPRTACAAYWRTTGQTSPTMIFHPSTNPTPDSSRVPVPPEILTRHPGAQAFTPALYLDGFFPTESFSPMPLPAPEIEREPLHTRTVRVDAYARADGQWDLEAELIDVKHYDFPLRKIEDGLHRAGTPVHHMLLRVTFDESFTITNAQASYEAAPY